MANRYYRITLDNPVLKMPETEAFIPDATKIRQDLLKQALNENVADILKWINTPPNSKQQFEQLKSVSVYDHQKTLGKLKVGIPGSYPAAKLEIYLCVEDNQRITEAFSGEYVCKDLDIVLPAEDNALPLHKNM